MHHSLKEAGRYLIPVMGRSNHHPSRNLLRSKVGQFHNLALDGIETFSLFAGTPHKNGHKIVNTQRKLTYDT